MCVAQLVQIVEKYRCIRSLGLWLGNGPFINPYNQPLKENTEEKAAPSSFYINQYNLIAFFAGNVARKCRKMTSSAVDDQRWLQATIILN